MRATTALHCVLKLEGVNVTDVDHPALDTVRNGVLAHAEAHPDLRELRFSELATAHRDGLSAEANRDRRAMPKCLATSRIVVPAAYIATSSSTWAASRRV